MSPLRRRRLPLLPPVVAWAFLVASVVVSTVYLAAGAGALADACTSLVTLGAVAAGIVGVVANRPERRRPWSLFVASSVLFTVASVLRASAGVNDGEIPLADLISVIGFLCLIAVFFLFVRGAEGRRTGVVIDAAVVAVGAGLVGWIILVGPSLDSDRTLTQHLADVVFPTLEAVLLSLTLRLAAAHRKGATVGRLSTVMVAFMLAADLQWALSATEVVPFPVATQIFCYLVAFGCFGAAALHPTMRELGQPAPADVPALGPSRAVALALTLTLPTLAALTNPPDELFEWIVVSSSSVVLCVLVLWRTLRAVRENERGEDRLRYQAGHDPLTGLPNRWLLMQRMTTLLHQSAVTDRTVGLVHADLEKFGQVNDTWGHAVGDELLGAVATRLRHALPEAVVIASIDGGKFALLIDGVDESSLDNAETLVRSCFERPFPLEVGEVFSSCTIGMSLSGGRRHASTAIDLLREADTALHRAKASGPAATVRFEPSMRVSTGRRLELDRGLRRAVARDEFEVHYQPIVSLRDGTWEGLEALVRWRHPEQGLIAPNDFIPVAEENGLIGPIGAIVLDKACHQLADWRSRLGVDWTMSVNFSVRQLRDPDIANAVRRALSGAGLPPEKLWVEIVESLMLADETGAMLTTLREVGVRLVVDDFGTGYSSLSYLKRFPIDRVKIDRSFVMGLGDDADSAALVKAVVGMTSALRLACVAEGIETELQRRILQELGCHHGQGYLFSRPAPAEDIERLYLQRPRRIVAARPVPAASVLTG